MKIFLATLFILIAYACSAQSENHRTSTRDTTLHKILKHIPPKHRKEFIEQYNSMSAMNKEFMAALMAEPESSKKKLVANIKAHYKDIYNLKQWFNRVAPPGKTVYIELEPPNATLHLGENVTLQAFNDSGGINPTVIQEWNIPFNSPHLDSLLAVIGWNRATLNDIKAALAKAHCISIKNGEPADIGFARSGMGMYSYLLFNNDLAPEMISGYNDKCRNIYYKKNIVLQYGGGAIGPQCFPDKD